MTTERQALVERIRDGLRQTLAQGDETASHMRAVRDAWHALHELEALSSSASVETPRQVMGWRCIHCDAFRAGASIVLDETSCDCGVGKGRWEASPGPWVRGSWPAMSVQRAFVDGASWWDYAKTGGTMWPSDRDRAGTEAVKRYGEPSPSDPPIPSPGDEGRKEEIVKRRARELDDLVADNDSWGIGTIERVIREALSDYDIKAGGQ